MGLGYSGAHQLGGRGCGSDVVELGLNVVCAADAAEDDARLQRQQDMPLTPAKQYMDSSP